MDIKTFGEKAAKIYAVVQRELPDGMYMMIATEDNQHVEFFDSRRRCDIVELLHQLRQEHLQALAEESARNN